MNTLTLDAGGSSLKYALCDGAMNLTGHGRIPNTFSTQEDFVEAIAAVYEQHRDEVEGIALSYCGELDPTTGVVFNGGSYGFNTGTNLKRILSERCGVPVAMESDGNCAALAEVRRGNLRGHADSVTLVLGTGLPAPSFWGTNFGTDRTTSRAPSRSRRQTCARISVGATSALTRAARTASRAPTSAWWVPSADLWTGSPSSNS